MELLLAASDPSAAYQTGFYIGTFFWVAVFIAVLLYNAFLFRRKSHHPLALAAICSLCLGLAGAYLLYQLGKNLSSPAFKIALGLWFVTTIGIAFILAIVSLLLIFQKPAGTRLKGRTQAIWTLTLCLLNGMIFIGGLVQQGLSNYNLTAQARTPVELKEYNCVIAAPEKPWATYDFSKINPAAKAAYMRPDLQMFFILIPEVLTSETEVTKDAYIEVVKSNLKSASVESKIIKEEDVVLNGLTFRHIEANAKINKLNLVYSYYIYLHNGYFYQMLTWGNEKNRTTINSEALDFAQRFQQINPDGKQTAAKGNFLKDYHSDVFAYSLRLEDSTWTDWSTKDKELPEADFAAIHNTDTVLAVIPVHLGDFKPDFQALTKALFSLLNMDWKNQELELIQKKKDEHQESWLFGFQRKVDTRLFLYRYRIIQAGKYAYLAGIWRPQSDASDDGNDLNRELDRLTLDPESGKPKTVPAPPDFWNQMGLYYLEKETYTEALPYFVKAAELKPSSPVFADNIAYTYYLLDKPEEALKEIEKRSASFKVTTELLNTKALAQEKLEKVDDAFDTWKTLLSMKGAGSKNLTQFIDFAVRTEKAKEAKALMDSLPVSPQSTELKLKIADMFYASEGMPRASAYLDDLKKTETKLDPADIEKKRASLLYKDKNYQGVIQLCQTMLAEGSHPADFLAWRGHSEWELEWYREAKQTFQEILKLRPNDHEAEDAVKRLSAKLGQGETKWVINPIDPVELPELLPPSKDENLFAGDYFKDAEAIYLDRIRGYYFEPGKPIKKTQRSVVQLKKQEGIKEFSSLTYKFDPLQERLYVNHVIVKKKTGEIISKGDVENFYVLDDTSDEMAKSEKVLHIPVAGLEIDSIVDIEITWEDLHPSDEMGFVDFSVSNSYPCLRSILSLQAPKDSFSIAAPKDVEKIPFSKGVTSWFMLNPPIYKFEDSMPEDAEVYPSIQISGKGGNWSSLIAEYLDQIGPKLQINDELKEQAEKLVEGQKTDRDKVRVLAKFVQGTVNYKAIEFGSRGIIPESGEITFKNKYGDCKDHAVYLYQLLKAVGIDSYLTLVNTEDALIRSLPSMDQFNHMIVAIPDKEGMQFVDTTDKDGSVWNQPPANLIGREVLLLKKSDPVIQQILSPSPDENKTTVRRNVRVNPESKEVTVTENIHFQGYTAGDMRAYYRSLAETERLEQTNNWMNSTGLKVSCTRISFERLDETDQPLDLSLEFTIKNMIIPTGSQTRLEIPSFWERYLLELPLKQKRLHDYLLKYGYSFESETVVEGFTSHEPDVPEFKQSLLNGMISVESRDSHTPTAIRKYSSMSVKAGKIPSNQYQETSKDLGKYFDQLEASRIVESVK